MALVRKETSSRPTKRHGVPDKLLELILLLCLSSPLCLDGGHGLVFVPSSPPKVAVNGCHFSLDFLPAGGAGAWEIVDSRHSLLLVAKRKPGWRRHRLLPDLLVCEPVTRRYKLIPSMEDQGLKYHRCIGVFLHDCGAAEDLRHGAAGSSIPCQGSRWFACSTTSTPEYLVTLAPPGPSCSNGPGGERLAGTRRSKRRTGPKSTFKVSSP